MLRESGPTVQSVQTDWKVFWSLGAGHTVLAHYEEHSFVCVQLEWGKENPYLHAFIIGPRD